ncbi:hypothetical protein LJB42_002361 [Komagataella kurtzmanii]|nr:hypothetical protein LJB42_002361 [Komagataella kurtzmanii]
MILRRQYSIKRGKQPLLGRASNNLSGGIVGLANVGKSTFFQAITKSKLGNPANYPFATISPEEARVEVTSPKLDHLQHLYGSLKKIPAYLKVVDIAGLVRGASRGEGLGNQFLGDIRQVDGLFQVVRGFRDTDVTHVEGNVDPVRDLMVVEDELLLKDMEFVESALERTKKQLRHRHQRGLAEIQLLEEESDTLNKASAWLLEGKLLSRIDANWNTSQMNILNKHNLLTAKPSVYLLNVSETDYKKRYNDFSKDVEHWVDEHSPGSSVVLVSAQYENSLALDSSSYKTESCIPLIVDEMRKCLHLIGFYTCGDIESRQWTVRENTLAPDAAGVIHTDLSRTFINATVIKYDVLKSLSPPLNEKSLRSKGLLHRVGKTYLIEDGDILHFNAAKCGKR